MDDGSDYDSGGNQHRDKRHMVNVLLRVLLGARSAYGEAGGLSPLPAVARRACRSQEEAEQGAEAS
jgi:hypothetical protein